MILTKKLLTYIFEKSKILKSDLILYNGQCKIYGSNLNYTIIKHFYDGDLPHLSYSIEFISKDMQVFIKNMNTIDDELIINQDGSLICGDNIIWINNPYRISTILNTYTNFIMNIKTDNLLINIENAKQCMQNALSCKAAEKEVVKINNNLMLIMHGSMLPINKNDKVSISVYKYNYISNIYIITILKKNKYPINVYMLCLNID